MSTKVILVGVGGQGTITTARILINGLMEKGYDVKMSEIHGMAQRGGSVSTHVIWGDKVNSPVVGLGEADILVAAEKMEAVRYAEFLKPDGIAIVNDHRTESSTSAAGLEEYPEGTLEAMEENFTTYSVKAGEIAEELGNAKVMNVVLFGAMVNYLGLEGIDWKKVVASVVPEKLVDLNIKAFEMGQEAAK